MRRGMTTSNEAREQWPGKLGCHISIRGGYLKAAQTAAAIGAESFQYFPKNPRSLSVKSYDRIDAAACQTFCQEHQLKSIAHTSYPVNLGSTDPELNRIMLTSLLNDLEIAEACGSIGVVVHFGKYKGDHLLTGYHTVINSLNGVLSQWNGKALLLIENQAGDGSRMGMYLEELVQIRNSCDAPERVGFCFDTCHAFAGECWNERNLKELLTKGHELGYTDHLQAIHCNDSVYGPRSYKDRHARVGEGKIGMERMLQFLNSSWIKDIPVILETPVQFGQSHEEQLIGLRKELHRK